MDVEYWDSRLMLSKHTNARSDHLSAPYKLESPVDAHLAFDDTDDNSRACFPCPYCYLEIETRYLCMHLQEEHCFDVRNAVCPVCAENLGRDMIGHFTIQHSHLVKRRKPHKSDACIDGSTLPGKDLQELTSFLGVTSPTGKRGNTADSPDPLLSPFLCSVVTPHITSDQETNSSSAAGLVTVTTNVESKVTTNSKELDRNHEEKVQRAEFFQQLVLSTIF